MKRRDRVVEGTTYHAVVTGTMRSDYSSYFELRDALYCFETNSKIETQNCRPGGPPKIAVGALEVQAASQPLLDPAGLGTTPERHANDDGQEGHIANRQGEISGEIEI